MDSATKDMISPPGLNCVKTQALSLKKLEKILNSQFSILN